MHSNNLPHMLLHASICGGLVAQKMVKNDSSENVELLYEGWVRLNPSFICNGVGGGCEFLLAPLKLTTDHLLGIANPLLNQYPVLCLQSLDLDIELQCWELYSQCPFAVYRSLCPCANSPGWMGVHVWFKVSKTCSVSSECCQTT